MILAMRPDQDPVRLCNSASDLKLHEHMPEQRLTCCRAGPLRAAREARSSQPANTEDVLLCLSCRVKLTIRPDRDPVRLRNSASDFKLHEHMLEHVRFLLLPRSSPFSTHRPRPVSA